MPYYFNPIRSGAIGFKTPKKHICGNLLHVNEKMEMLWMNNGVFEFNGKRLGKLKYETFSHFIITTLETPGKWYISYNNSERCYNHVHAKLPSNRMGPISNNELSLIQKQVELQKDVVSSLDNINLKLKLDRLDKVITKWGY